MKDRSWPNAPIDGPRLNSGYRGITAVGSAARNGCNGFEGGLSIKYRESGNVCLVENHLGHLN
jgi:hypothetical protein